MPVGRIPWIFRVIKHRKTDHFFTNIGGQAYPTGLFPPGISCLISFWVQIMTIYPLIIQFFDFHGNSISISENLGFIGGMLKFPGNPDGKHSFLVIFKNHFHVLGG